MTPERVEIAVNPRDVIQFLVRGALAALLVAAALGAAVYQWSARQEPVFRAEASLLISRSQPGLTQFGLSSAAAQPLDLTGYRAAAVSAPVLMDALRATGTPEPSVDDVRHLREAVVAFTEAGVRDSSVLRIEARGSTTEEAIARADATASALITWDQDRARSGILRVVSTLERQIEALETQVRVIQATGDADDTQGQIDGLIRLRAEQQQQLGYARALVSAADGTLSLLQASGTRVEQVAPRPWLNSAIAVVLAVTLVYGLLLLRAALDTRLRSSEGIANATGLTVLAEVPAVPNLDDPRLREAGSYLHANLVFKTYETHPRTFIVTSARENEGKTTIARILAEGFARSGYQTLLVDCDLRAPAVARLYEFPTSVMRDVATTEDWLRDATGSEQVVSIALDSDGQLDIVPQFTAVPDAPEMLWKGFRRALGRWQRSDIVIIDAPPVLAVSDVLAMAPFCSGTVFVVDRTLSDQRQVAAAVAALEGVGANVLGFVSNKVDRASGTTYGYGYGYGYGLKSKHSLESSQSARAVPGTSVLRP